MNHSVATTSSPSASPAPDGLRILFVGAALVVALAGIYMIQSVVAPVFLAITLVLTLRPLVVWLNRHGWPPFLSAVVGLLLLYAFLIAMLLAVTFAFSQFVQAMPTYSTQFNALYNEALNALSRLGVSQSTITSYFASFDFTRLLGTVTGVVGQIGSSATFVGSLFLFSAFVAIDLADTKERRSTLTQVRPRLAAALVDFSWRVRKYWIVNTVFGLGVALINMGILTWLQIPLVLTWGILSFVTAYIPNVGFLIGMIPPALMALLARDVQTMIVLVAAYVVVNFIASMVIQPKVTGDAVGLNITTTFISLVFWSIIIGPIGAILAVPLTLFVKGVLFDSDPRTRWVSIFMGGNLDNIAPGERVEPLDAPPLHDDDDLAAHASNPPERQADDPVDDASAHDGDLAAHASNPPERQADDPVVDPSAQDGADARPAPDDGERPRQS